MSDRLLRIYHQLPPGLRSVAATARGLYLRRWRYGPETPRLVEEALDRESWMPAQWESWRQERLSHILRRAVRDVPYYREWWSAYRRRGGRASWEYLQNWPILERESLRRNPRAFLAAGCDPGRMFPEHTSGTTGGPLTVWHSLGLVRARYALYEARLRRWWDLSCHDRWGLIGGRLVVPVSQCRPPFWVWNAALNQLYLSSHHLASRCVPSYLEALDRYRPKYLMGYASSLHLLADEICRGGWTAPGMAVVITTSEPLFPYQRRAIEKAFRCPVRETYGMVEMVAAASECQGGNLHVWPEVGWIEVCDRDHLVAAGQAGDFLCTSLLDEDMPLIRYRVGDRGALADPRATCACGRRLPLLSRVEGRADETLYTPDGRRIGQLSPVFKEGLPIREAQVIQVAPDRVQVRYVPAPNFTDAAAGLIAERVRARMGPVHVDLEALETIPREPNGKFRTVICALRDVPNGKSGSATSLAPEEVHP